MVWVAQQSFASGEVSPSVYGIVSSQQYQSGCRELVNALLTPTGAARKRYGTERVLDVTSGYPARLFFYFAKGKQFVIQFVSEDDDAVDLNTTSRQVRVIDATTRQFINFADNKANGPFDSFGSTAGHFHHFTASQLPNVYAFQDNERIFFCHPDRPTLFMERQIGDSGDERWEYGIAPPSATTPRIVDHQVAANLSVISGTQFEFDQPLFDKRDEGAFWRIGGAESTNPDTNIYGTWIRTDNYKSPFRMDGTSIYGTVGEDLQDWTGPYTSTGTTFLVSINPSSSTQNTTTVVTWTGGVDAKVNWIGLPITLFGVLYLVTAVSGAKEITVARLGPGPFLSAGDLHTLELFALAANAATPTNEFLDQRPYLSKHPISPSASSGSITLYSQEGFLPDAISAGTDLRWLPEGHATTFDRIDGSVEIGGTVHLNGGIVALTGIDQTAGPGSTETVYTARVVKTLAHVGPSMQWGLGQSNSVGFPACGTTHQGRVWFGGYKEKPTRVVASRVFDSEDFVPGSLDDDSIAFDISDPMGGRVTWMESAADLLVGTATSEFMIGGRPITASNLAVERQSGIGSRNIRPVLIDNSAVFVDGGGKGLREMTFRDELNRYQSPDLTDLAKHIFEDIVIEEVAYVGSPSQIVYVRDSNNLVYALSIWRLNGVAGWSRFTQPSWPKDTGTATDTSTIESITAVRADGVNIKTDELWVVRRFFTGGASAAGTETRWIERMTPDFAMDATVPDPSPTSTTFDAGAILVDLPATYNAQLMLRETASDAYVFLGNFAVSSSGEVTYADAGFTPDRALLGREIEFKLVPLIPHFSIEGQGDTQGRLENVASLLVLLRESIGGTVSGGSLMPPGVSIPNSSNPATAIDAITEWRKVVSVGTFGTMHEIPIVHTPPYYFEVAGLNFQVTHGR